jgi:phage capsid family|nr:MAG TPA: major capsid protein [Caudoviricetes sp.]
MATTQASTFFTPELVKELFSKVQGKSVLAKLSAQQPIPFTGTTQMVFNLEGNAQIVGEGGKKEAGEAKIEPKVITPQKFVYQARISEEFLKASEQKQLEFLDKFAEGFAKKIAEAFDIAAIHGVEPKTLTDASFRDKNSFDGLVKTNIVTYDAEHIDDNIDAAVQQIVAKGGEVTGIALSPTAGQALSKIKVNGVTQYPEFRFGQNPNSFYGMDSDMTKNLTLASGSHTAETDHVIVGDFANRFKWGYADSVPLEIIKYGDPDQTGRDLKAYNEICLRSEVYIGWGILDADGFARVKA